MHSDEELHIVCWTDSSGFKKLYLANRKNHFDEQVVVQSDKVPCCLSLLVVKKNKQKKKQQPTFRLFSISD